MKCHPFMYLCCLILVLTVLNVLYVTRSSHKLGQMYKEGYKKKSSQFSVKLIDDDESTILARIRFPNRKLSLLYGKHSVGFHASGNSDHFTHSRVGTVITMGIATVARPSGVDYLTKTLTQLLSVLSDSEKSVIVFVVAFMDESAKVRQERARRTYEKFRLEVDSGLIQIIAPTENIYPRNNYTAMHRTYGNSAEITSWQAKLSLDFAFLFSYSKGLSDYFINLEDDIVPEKNFVTSILSFVEEQNKAGDWASIIFSKWLSIGRLYRDSDLTKLVDLILIAYTKQPVDFIMHHFDVIQMATDFREIRRQPPLFEHVGEQSSLRKMSLQQLLEGPLASTKKLNTIYDDIKIKNPNAELHTNITQWLNFSLEAAYYPQRGFFWGKSFKPGDDIDIVLQNEAVIHRVQIHTGFDRTEVRAGNDVIKSGQLYIAPQEQNMLKQKIPCNEFKPVATFDDFGHLEFLNPDSDTKLKCVKIRIWKGQSDWVIIRLIQIILK